jgi:hypothetical protein
MGSDWKLIEDDREKYAAYLCSREWSVLKKEVHERAGGVCERCRLNGIDSVHHLTYARKYRERIDDLLALCNGCHAYIHAKTDTDPAKNVVLSCYTQAGDLVMPTSQGLVDLTSSIGISVWKGLVDVDELRRNIELAIESGLTLRRKDEDVE